MAFQCIPASKDSVRGDLLNFAYVIVFVRSLKFQSPWDAIILDLDLTNEPLIVCGSQVTTAIMHAQVLFKLYFDYYSCHLQLCATKHRNWLRAEFAGNAFSLSSVQLQGCQASVS
jgi:hypothetical protein